MIHQNQFLQTSHGTRLEELNEESNTNIQSEEGILKRQTRSIQTGNTKTLAVTSDGNLLAACYSPSIYSDWSGIMLPE